MRLRRLKTLLRPCHTPAKPLLRYRFQQIVDGIDLESLESVAIECRHKDDLRGRLSLAQPSGDFETGQPIQ